MTRSIKITLADDTPHGAKTMGHLLAVHRLWHRP